MSRQPLEAHPACDGNLPRAYTRAHARLDSPDAALLLVPEISPHGRSRTRAPATRRVIARRAFAVSTLRNGRKLAMERKKTGRPSKGDRAFVNFKLPRPLIAAMKEQAAERGMTITDLVGETLAAEVGVPYQLQEGLPLNQAS